MALDALNNIVDNNAPVLGSPLVYLTTANQKLGHDLAQFFTDHDLDDDGKTLDYRVIALQDADGNTPRGDVLVLQGTTLTFDPNGSYDSLEIGEYVDLWATVIATDSHGASVEEMIPITILGTAEPENYQVNRAPYPQTELVMVMESDQSLSYDLARVFDDLDGDDDGTTLDYRVTALHDADGNTPHGDVFVMQGTNLTFDPNGFYDDLEIGESVNLWATVIATDSHGASVEEQIKIEIFGTAEPENYVGNAPHMTLDALGLAARADSFVYYDLDRIFDDIDPEDDGSTLEYSIITATNNDDGSFAHGTFTMSQNRMIFDTANMYNHLGDGEMAEITIVVQAQDSTGLTVQEDIFLTVYGDESPLNEIGQAISDIFMV